MPFFLDGWALPIASQTPNAVNKRYSVLFFLHGVAKIDRLNPRNSGNLVLLRTTSALAPQLLVRVLFEEKNRSEGGESYEASNHKVTFTVFSTPGDDGMAASVVAKRDTGIESSKSLVHFASSKQR